MSARLLAALVSVALASGPPARAATPEQFARVEVLAGLGQTASAADLRGIETVLALPEDVPLSARFLDGTVPGWRSLARTVRSKASGRVRGPWRQVADRFEKLSRQVRTDRPAGDLRALRLDARRYRAAVAALAGQGSLPWPGAGRQVRFTNRLMGHPDNQLGELCDFLGAYYRSLGLRVDEQVFDYEGRRYRNVMATIPGNSPEAVLLVDHIDVAPAADYAEGALAEARAYGLSAKAAAAIRAGHRTGWPAPGADDDASGTAALMEAGRILAGGPRPGRTIRLVHLNGEEFPGDSYGAKKYVARARARREPIVGVVVLDMIGVNRQRDRIFQVAPGPDAHSVALADTAVRAAARVAPGYRPRVRLFDDHRSYLYNTDGQVFSAAGYPVILLNEHLNYHRDLERLGYHDEFDRTELIDWDYARAIARTGIATAWLAASAPVAPAVEGWDAPERRVSHFQIELRHSPLYEAMESREKATGRPLTDAELAELIRQDLAVAGDPSQHDSSIVRRLTTWFPQLGWKPIDTGSISGELRYLRARQRLGFDG